MPPLGNRLLLTSHQGTDMYRLFNRFLDRLPVLARSTNGTTSLEYGVMAGLIAGVIIVAVTLIGTNINGVFGALNTALAAVPGA